MRKISADHTTGRVNRRKPRRSHSRAAAASVVIFAVLISLTAAGLSFVFVGYQGRAVGSAEQIAIAGGKGRIVQVGTDSCSKIEFNNLNGHFSGSRSIPCPDGRTSNQDYQYPADRMQRFSKGFVK